MKTFINFSITAMNREVNKLETHQELTEERQTSYIKVDRKGHFIPNHFFGLFSAVSQVQFPGRKPTQPPMGLTFSARPIIYL